MSRGSIHAILPGAGRQHDAGRRATTSRCLSMHGREERRLQHRRRARRAASRRSIARWLPCRPVSSPAIGMFETFTMCSTPGALGGLDRVGLELDLIPRRRRHEEHARHARARARRATRDRARSPTHDVGHRRSVAGERPAHERAHLDAARPRARTRPRRPSSPVAPITSTVTAGESRGYRA